MLDGPAAVVAACRVLGLEDIEVIAESHGGVNRVWRVRNGRGDYAVHELLGLPAGPTALNRCEWVASLELAAIRAGVRAPAPVLAPGSGAAAVTTRGTAGVFVAHVWCDAPPVTPDRMSEAFAASLGDSLARVHALGHPPLHGPDLLDRRPTVAEWERMSARADAAGLSWGPRIGAAAHDLESALRTLDYWDRRSVAPVVSSHRDLTSANLLDDNGAAVLIDWESAGVTRTSAEIGRTALDNFLRGDTLEPKLLAAYLDGYAAQHRLPAVDVDWCSLWIRGLIVFAEQCASSHLAGGGPQGLLDLQLQVIETTPNELKRRLLLAPKLVEQFRVIVAGRD